MSVYAVAHIVHLFCAVAFVGGVFFEMLVLSAMHGKQVSHEARKEVEQAISRRAVRVMPWIIIGLFVSGLLCGGVQQSAGLVVFDTVGLKSAAGV